jgi:hypothetical protein
MARTLQAAFSLTASNKLEPRKEIGRITPNSFPHRKMIRREYTIVSESAMAHTLSYMIEFGVSSEMLKKLTWMKGQGWLSSRDLSSSAF